MKKNYESPCAELICFVPAERITAKPWDWDPKNGMFNHWYQEKEIEIASVNTWVPIDTDELADA